jgi:hypothetical protein
LQGDGAFAGVVNHAFEESSAGGVCGRVWGVNDARHQAFGGHALLEQCGHGLLKEVAEGVRICVWGDELGQCRETGKGGTGEIVGCAVYAGRDHRWLVVRALVAAGLSEDFSHSGHCWVGVMAGEAVESIWWHLIRPGWGVTGRGGTKRPPLLPSKLRIYHPSIKSCNNAPGGLACEVKNVGLLLIPNLFVQIQGLSFHEAMRQITSGTQPPRSFA